MPSFADDVRAEQPKSFRRSRPSTERRRRIMDNRSECSVAKNLEEAIQEAGGAVKEGFGKLTGNEVTEAEGTAENPIRFVSLLDDDYGFGGTFDTNGIALPDGFTSRRIAVGAAPCRIVRADLSGERRLPPMIAGTVATTGLAVQAVTLDGGKITSRTGLPGIPVEFRDKEGTVLGRTVTDEFGRLRPTNLLPSATSSIGVLAATTPPSYAFLL